MSFFGLDFIKKKERELERKLRANDREYNLIFKYATNAIKTSKYNFFTFLPLNLFEQFQRIANAYFLFLLVLQVIPQISSLSWFTTVVPLVLVLSVTAAKDATDDIADLLLLSSSEPLNLVYIETAELDGLVCIELSAVNVQIVHYLFCTCNSLSPFCSGSFPHPSAHLLFSSSSICPPVFIRETNLKVRQALTVTGDLGDDIERLADFNGEVRCEPPNNRLDRFKGTLTYADQKYPLDNEKILLRGCTLRNTEWCFGLVLFGGPETKLMQNCGKSTFKRTSIDRLMNVLVLCIFGFLAFMCTILAIGNYVWELNEGSNLTAFLPRQNGNDAALSAFLTFWSYVIILNTLVPISLYVSVEIIRLGNSFYIDWDSKMFYTRNNTPAEARTTTLNEELGQIKYVFSDKTGTLTQNIMTFNKCSINGKCYGDIYDYTGQRLDITEHTETVDFSFNTLADPRFVFHDHALVEAVKLENPEVHAFFRLLALCHTVMVEEKKEGEIFYQAQSPDEGALVTAARNFGFVFRSRTPDSISIVEMGQQCSYELLAILDFNNIRKRMSVIVRSPEGKLSLYCKGADTIVYERLHQSCSKMMDVTTEHLNEFAGEGLRTLVLAYKDLDEEYFSQWKQRHHQASTELEERESKLDQLYEEIEKDLLLLGATAIEDKLQDGVPQTIEQLSKADIKIWVLTGDKQETAENIGYSCNLLREEMKEVFVISGNSSEDVRQELRNARMKMKPDVVEESVFLPERTLSQRVKTVADEVADGEYGLVINGHSLAYALDHSTELELLKTACMCKAVICCRVTPLQKAQVVELVKKYKQAVTLAIGDGANDVSMIRAAHIGVGISGQEGMQAVLSSDYSFAQFRFLQRLLLVHGRWSYLRMCKFLRYFFYKNFTFTFVHFWYAFFCGFSAQTVYDEWFITLYNLMYTALPVLGMSLFDQDVNDVWSFEHPQLYIPGQLNLYFSKRSFFKCALHSCYSSLVLFFIPYAAMYNTVRDDGKDVADYQSFALLTQTCLLFAVSIQLGLEMSYWTAVNTFFVLGSLAIYFAVTFTMYSNGLFLALPSAFPFVGIGRNSLQQPNVWLTILLTSILCVLPVVTYRFLLMQLCPTINDKVMFKVRQAKATPPPPTQRARIRRTSSRRSGYAFSHAQGYGDLVTSGRFLRRPAVSRSTALTHMGRTTSGFSPMGRSAGYSPTGRPQNIKAPDVEVTSLQMYRTISDPVP
ncbi:phospholipid-transporting ATPase ID-like isoform X2 [Antennarius striatus]|uniref:phospholipid-transporting ATPase ID-like isoform X2 n=1 Tax=Antennarius striatus TaxID=241820 RepID=UPI0035B00E16